MGAMGGVQRDTREHGPNSLAFRLPDPNDDDSDDLTDEFGLPAFLEIPLATPDPKSETLIAGETTFRSVLRISNSNTRGPPAWH